jgi:hypothetical protein
MAALIYDKEGIYYCETCRQNNNFKKTIIKTYWTTCMMCHSHNQVCYNVGQWLIDEDIHRWLTSKEFRDEMEHLIYDRLESKA